MVYNDNCIFNTEHTRLTFMAVCVGALDQIRRISMTFNAGQSGNPGGRPKGITDRRSKFRGLLEPYAEELVTKVVELARNGDVNALRFCLERLIPKATREPVTLDFDASGANKIEYLAEFGKSILRAVANGDITPADGQCLSVLADTHRRLIEHGEIKRMLEEVVEARKMGR